MNPVIAVTMGDPAGIGAEIIMKALNHESVYQSSLPIVIGDAKMLERAMKLFPNRISIRKIATIAEAKPEFGVVNCLNLDLLPPDLPYGSVSAVAGEAAYRYIEKAIALAVHHKVDAICTAPINKEAIHLAGHRYPGHTEILASLTGT